ncbi:hypothetical protein UFOVP71_145 [uncultured Caudovirales phage]|uniref:Uncharacterized protein n=1 Tax=uncultured Caudovirales phage TaxID=2100421 RepID=A0A6J5TCD8_9CAUD|nr:hypothetical protein UFOVP71_145 [uncultured Caudovirales phage]
MPIIYTEVEIDVDLEEFETDDLVEELERRGQVTGTARYGDATTQLIKIYELRRLGKEYEKELDNYIYDVLGHVI